MTKQTSSILLDYPLTRVRDGLSNLTAGRCDKLTICSGDPTTYSEANTTLALGSAAMTGTDFSAITASGNNRYITVLAKNGVSITAPDNTATTICLLDTGSSTLLHVTDLTAPTAVSQGGTADVGPWNIQYNSPT